MTSAVGSPSGAVSRVPAHIDQPGPLARPVELTPGTWARWTSRQDGDFALATAEAGERGAGLADRRRALVPLPWTWLRQVHGATVVEVHAPGAGAGTEADGAVTAAVGGVLSVLTADCASVALASEEGPYGVAHAGWRGLESGVLEAAVGGLRRLGAGRIRAQVGPVIGACCYEFGPSDLERLVGRYGAAVRAMTAGGRPALDLVAGVRIALDRVGVPLDTTLTSCTACGAGRWFSHRARAETGRQVLAVWREAR